MCKRIFVRKRRNNFLKQNCGLEWNETSERIGDPMLTYPCFRKLHPLTVTLYGRRSKLACHHTTRAVPEAFVPLPQVSLNFKVERDGTQLYRLRFFKPQSQLCRNWNLVPVPKYFRTDTGHNGWFPSSSYCSPWTLGSNIHHLMRHSPRLRWSRN